MYICIYVYSCMYIYVYICEYVYTCIHIHMYIYIYTFTYMWVCRPRATPLLACPPPHWPPFIYVYLYM